MKHRFFGYFGFLVLVFMVARLTAETIDWPSIMEESRKTEDYFRHTGQLFESDEISSYLNGIIAKLLLSGDKNIVPLHVLVLKSSAFNAFATPHGAIYLCSGILSRIGNEAQLAALLGHEMTHILREHASRSLLNAKATAALNARSGLALEFLLGGISEPLNSLVLQSAITGYSRDLEREADSVGLARMQRAGYSTVEFRNLFVLLKKNIEREKIKEPFFFSTHPKIVERIENYYQMAGRDTVSVARGFIGKEIYLQTLKPVLQLDGVQNYHARKAAVAREIFGNVLAVDSCNGEALVCCGDLTRRETFPAVSAEALTWYRKAVRCERGGGNGSRALGYYYFSAGRKDSAASYFKRAIEQDSTFTDIHLIRDFLKQCGR